MSSDPSLRDPLRVRFQRIRASAAVLAGAALVAAGLPASAAASEADGDGEAPRDGLVAEYAFSQTSGTAVSNLVADGPGAAEVVNGSDSLWTGSSLVLTGGSKSSTTADWVRLPADLLSGEDSASITIETKLDATMKSSYNFLWNIGDDATSQYWFTSVRDVARTAITTSGNRGEANAPAKSPLAADRWYSLTSVLDGSAHTLSFYVDGVLVGKTATDLTPAALTDQSLNAIGRSPYPDPFYKGEVSTFRVYDRALAAEEVAAVSDADGALHFDAHRETAQKTLAGVADVVFEEASTTLPDYGGIVRWSSSDPAVTVAADGRTATVAQPETGEPAMTAELTATAVVHGQEVSRSVPVTIEPAPGVDTPFGYVMVHFVEDSAGYAEKIYLDVSRGDDPEQWDPLNGGKPILASDLGTTGVRDPYLTYNPENETYYIIATDLRVFGGDQGSGSCTSWCHWSSQGSTKLNVWESKDLVTWSDLRQFDVAATADGVTHAELGMAWAPEATWVPDFHGEGKGAFVLYWSSNVYSDSAHTGATYSRVLWGATTDFTQESYAYGGVFVDAGADAIDTTLIQNEGTTYRITKDNGLGKGIYMESTTAREWWLPTTTWKTIQTRIGAGWAGGNAGGVEGPAVFPRHDAEEWYLYVDVIPSTGYRPMETTDLDAGWSELTSPDFFMAPSTKHGGVVSLTKGQYDVVRNADAVSAVDTHLGAVEVPSGSAAAEVRGALPAEARVNLAYGRGVATLPVDWDLASLDADAEGPQRVTGTVRSIGANLNQWQGAGGSTAWNAPDRKLYSSTAIRVTADVVVTPSAAGATVATSTRCVAGRVVLAVSVTNESAAPLDATLSTPYGAKTLGALGAGKTVSIAFNARLGSVPAGTVTVTDQVTAATATAAFEALACGTR